MTNPPFKFHQINDIRKCWIGSPSNSFWVVDYKVTPHTLTVSVRWDELSGEDQARVYAEFRNLYFYENNFSQLPFEEAMREMDNFFSQYWELIPEVEF